MTSPHASRSQTVLSYALSVYLLATAGCLAVPRDARPTSDVAVFFDPLARQDETWTTDRTRQANFVEDSLRSLDESLLNLFHGRRLAAWDAWGRVNLQDGDIVFLQSASNWVWGFIEFSKVTQDVTDSPFTHVALAALEDGEIVLYDIDTPGPGRTPFGRMMIDSQTIAVGVKRLRPEFQSYVPQAIEYCRQVYANQLPFDMKLKLDNDRLYCAELIEVAFRASGLELSQPTRWAALPGLDKHPVAVNTIAWANDTQLNEFVIVPGNDEIGIWASPGLTLVLPLTDAKKPPSWAR